MQHIYEKNIELIKELYETTFGKNHCGEYYFKAMIDAMYYDPDVYDERLIAKANNLSSKFNVKFGADGICGWKILFDLYDGNKGSTWVREYETIRGSKAGTLFWPCQEKGGRTINVQRNQIFGDRIDLTLFDIRCYIEKLKPKMCFENTATKVFLEKYRNSNEGFKKFIEDLGMTAFVDDNFKIYDLSVKDYQREFIDDEKHKKFKWTNRYKTEKKRELLGCYIENVLAICEKSEKWNNEEG